MKKILILLTALMIMTLNVSAASDVSISDTAIPEFTVTFNGQKIENGRRQFPLLVYKDITYVPMTYHDCRFLGLETVWNDETKTLSIEKTNITCAYRNYDMDWDTLRNDYLTLCNFNIIVNGNEITNSKEPYPLLTFRDVTYFPLTWRFAVEEFGWEYSFDSENGLVITSDNPHVENITLPNITGNAATDGNYYYYSGETEGKKVVYRASVSDTSNPEVILELIDTPMTRGADFINSEGCIYIEYFGGSSGVTGTNSYYKINPDGSVTEAKPDDNYSYGKHGTSEIRVASDGIKVIGTHEHIQGPTIFSYEIDGTTYEAEKLPVRVGRKRNGATLYNIPQDECVKIFKNKIYYTGTDVGAGGDSALYCIDTSTGKNEKILDGVCGFHVYTGWLNEEKADSTMIVFDKDGYLMRYSELNGDIIEIEDSGYQEQGLILENATGAWTVTTVQKTIGGDKTVVKSFNCYADGSCIRGTQYETTTGTEVIKSGDRICIITAGESPEDRIRLYVRGGTKTEFMSSDAPKSVFIYEDILLYTLGDGTVARVDLK